MKKKRKDISKNYKKLLLQIKYYIVYIEWKSNCFVTNFSFSIYNYTDYIINYKKIWKRDFISFLIYVNIKLQSFNFIFVILFIFHYKSV